MMLWLLIAGCADKTTEKGDEGLTYYKDAQPILAQNCARCHQDGGQAVSFDDPAVVQSMAPTIAAYVESGLMPPPAPDPSCRDYEGSALFTLDETEYTTLLSWVEQGAALGDPADATATEIGYTSLAPYDLELYMPSVYTASYDSTGNDNRCFLMELGNTDTVYLTGMEAIVDNLAIVHHIVLFDVTGLADISNDPSGFSCNGFGEYEWSFLGGWAPGQQPVALPDGMGIPLSSDAQLILQVHYFEGTGSALSLEDRSGYGLKLTDSVEKVVYNIPFGPYSYTIPAGESAYEVSDTFTWPSTYGALSILGVWPHMHQLGVGFDAYYKEDGEENCLVHMDSWDYHNQVASLFLEPPVLEGGEKITVSCTYDNSADNPNQANDPPQDVVWGEGTLDEMCFGFSLVALN